jgi:Helix-turn-helix domain
VSLITIGRHGSAVGMNSAVSLRGLYPGVSFQLKVQSRNCFRGYGDFKGQMLVNPSTNVSVSKADYGGPFLEGKPEINLRFGARLHDLRVQRALSQEDLAFRLLVPVSHLMDLEAGRKSASIIDLDSFAREFKLSIAELLLGL